MLLGRVAVRQEVPVELGERAVQLGLGVAVGLDLEPPGEQARQLLVVALLLEQDPQPEERVAVAGIGLERALERLHRAIADQRLVHQHHAGEVVERGALLGIGGAGGLAVRGLDEIDPQLALERGLPPALERGHVAGQRGLGLAEALDGGVDLADRGERLAGAGPERGLGARIALEVERDLLPRGGPAPRTRPRAARSTRGGAARAAPPDRPRARGGRARPPRPPAGCRASPAPARSVRSAARIAGQVRRDRVEHGRAQAQELRHVVGRGVVALEAVQQIDAPGLGLRRRSRARSAPIRRRRGARCRRARAASYAAGLGRAVARPPRINHTSQT